MALSAHPREGPAQGQHLPHTQYCAIFYQGLHLLAHYLFLQPSRCRLGGSTGTQPSSCSSWRVPGVPNTTCGSVGVGRARHWVEPRGVVRALTAVQAVPRLLAPEEDAEGSSQGMLPGDVAPAANAWGEGGDTRSRISMVLRVQPQGDHHPPHTIMYTHTCHYEN